MKKLTCLAIFFWMTIVGIAFFWNYSTVKNSHQELAFQTSRAFFNQIVLDRAWNASHGGVYVPVTEKTKPNPYLEDSFRDLETNKGISLTKVNPAFMTRQIAEIAALESGVQFHITSLKPIRPENKATEWEKKWLQAFEQGIQEEGMFVQQNSKFIFHYMAPLLVKPNCLKCHAKHGYKEGDIRGGISVTLPFFPQLNVAPLFFGYGIASFTGFVFILISGFLLEKSRKKLVLAKESIEAEIKVRKAADSQWSAAMDIYDDAIYLLDMNRHLIRANKTFYLMTGSTPETAIGRHITEIVHPQGKPDPCPVCLAQEEKRDVVLIMEADHPDNPAGHPIEIIVKFILDEQDQPISIFMSLHDLTNSRKEIKEKQKLENQLRQAQKMEAIGTLAGGIAHDFNNILSPILGYADMAIEDIPPDSSTASDIKEVIKAGNRAKDLVKQILAFSRQAEQELRPLKVQLVVKEALKLLRASIPTTIEIKQNIDPGCGAVLADPTQIHQIIMNLCTNAYHAMRETGGVLGVTLTPVELGPSDLKNKIDLMAGLYVQLEVSDTGCGMDKIVLERIFDPYYTTKAKGEGTGLGLSVVHGIVKNLLGDITVYSEAGKGTTFHAYFPVVEAEAGKRVEAKVAERLPSGDEHVLVVDDEVAIVNMEQQMLSSLGYQVSCFTNCEEALKAFRTQPNTFDLIITDMTMPRITGMQLTKEVLAVRSDIPVILCTGFSELINEEKSKDAGISRYLMKPLLKKDLSIAVREVLDQKKS